MVDCRAQRQSAARGTSGTAAVCGTRDGAATRGTAAGGTAACSSNDAAAARGSSGGAGH